ncbi:MAG: molybdenum cofactor biosynthesis protein B [Chakrabartia sp.]
MPIDPARPFQRVGVAILTVSDSRTKETDSSGGYLCAAVQDLGHHLAGYEIVTDDIPAIQAQVRAWIADPEVQCILTTGGTGVTGRDVTPEALAALGGREIPGFGELFRWISFDKIGTSTIQSRAIGYVMGETYVFALPGSTGACRDAWEGILVHQLDSRFRPCNFIELIGRLGER